MKALTAQADAARDRRYAEPIYLLTLTLYRDQFGDTPVSTTLYLADRPRTELGHTWLPLVQSWGGVGDTLAGLGPGGSIGALDVVLFNTMPIDTPTVSAARFSDLVRAGENDTEQTWDIAFGEATLTLLFQGGAPGDQVALFGLRCEEVTNLTEASCVLRMTGRELSLEDAEDLYRVSTEDFPYCDPDAGGTPVPIAIGDVTHVPGIGLVAGLVHKLAVDLPASPVGTIAVSDAELLSRMPASGLLQVDVEQCSYTGVDLGAITLTGVTRGVAGTETVAHTRGAPVFQVLSEYVYAFAANPGDTHTTAAVPRIRSDGALVAPGSYTVNLNDTTLKAGRRFVTARFTVLPVIVKQIVLEVVDTIAVNDTIGVNDALTVGDNIDFVQTGSVSQGFSTTSVLPSDMDMAFWRSFAFPALPSGGAVTLIQYKITMWATAAAGAGSHITYVRGPGWGPITLTFAWALAAGGTVSFSWAVSSANPYGTVDVQQNNWEGGVTILECVVTRDPAPLTKSGSANRGGGVSKVGAATKVGTVTLVGNSSAETVLGIITADLTGITDTPTGTVTALTGGPGANGLLTNPADVTYVLNREVFGETDLARYRADVWQAARAALAPTGARWDFLYAGSAWSDFRKLVGLQSRCDLYMEGGEYLLRYRELTAAVHAFDARNLDGEPVFGWSPRTELVTTLTALYDPDPDNGTWRGSQEHRSTTPAAQYGSRRRIDKRAPGGRDLPLPWVRRVDKRGPLGRDLPLPWVRHTATATALATYWLGTWEVPRMTATLRGYWDAMALEKGDIVTIDAPVVTPFGALGFAIRAKRYRIGDGLVEIEAVEAGQYPSGRTRTLPAQYVVIGTLTRTLPAGYGFQATRDLTAAAAYRVLTSPALTLAAAYQLLGGLTRPATYLVRVDGTVTLTAGYAVGVGLYDTTVVYDGAAHYDGA